MIASVSGDSGSPAVGLRRRRAAALRHRLEQ
jgi:hypothetical protein